MRSIGIKELKNKLSAYVRLAAAGETVQVTDRGTVVAELVPSKRKKAATEEEILAELIREGIMTPAKDKSGTPPPKPPPIMTREQLLEDLARDREDR